nr:hypothetical protein [Clostridioides difficile]
MKKILSLISWQNRIYVRYYICNDAKFNFIVYITYKILDFPDMSADGSYTMGASIVAFSLTNGISPVVATLMAILCGCTAGLVTGILHIKFKISNLLSGILVMGMLYSINLRIMGKSNIPLFSFKHLFNGEISPIVLALAFVFICKSF